MASHGSGSEGFGFEPKRGISDGYRSIPGHNPIVSDFVGNPGHTRVKTRKAEIHRCIQIGSDRTFNPLVLGSSPSSLTGIKAFFVGLRFGQSAKPKLKPKLPGFGNRIGPVTGLGSVEG